MMKKYLLLFILFYTNQLHAQDKYSYLRWKYR
jgi:hypothetical protein